MASESGNIQIICKDINLCTYLQFIGSKLSSYHVYLCIIRATTPCRVERNVKCAGAVEAQVGQEAAIILV